MVRYRFTNCNLFLVYSHYNVESEIMTRKRDCAQCHIIYFDNEYKNKMIMNRIPRILSRIIIYNPN